MKQNNSIIETIFGVPVYISEKFNLNKETINFLKNHEYKHNSLGNRMSTNRNVLEAKECKVLKQFLQRQLDYYFHEVCDVVDELEIYITESWINMNSQGQMHDMHIHPNSIISGVYYFGEKTDCPISYIRPYYDLLFGSAFDLSYKQSNKYNTISDDFNNLLHKTILSPSKTQHAVPPNESQNTRYSLAYNSFVKGAFGQPKSANVLYLSSVL